MTFPLVFTFNAKGAEDVLDVVVDLSKKQLIKLEDTAMISWPVGKKKPVQTLC